MHSRDICIVTAIILCCKDKANGGAPQLSRCCTGHSATKSCPPPPPRRECGLTLGSLELAQPPHTLPGAPRCPPHAYKQAHRPESLAGRRTPAFPPLSSHRMQARVLCRQPCAGSRAAVSSACSGSRTQPMFSVAWAFFGPRGLAGDGAAVLLSRSGMLCRSADWTLVWRRLRKGERVGVWGRRGAPAATCALGWRKPGCRLGPPRPRGRRGRLA